MGIHDIVDVAGKSHGELGHGDEQGIAPAGGGPLDIHRGTTRGLTESTADIQSPLAHTLHKAAGGSAFTLTQWGGGYGGYLNILAVRLILQAVNYLHEIESAESPIRDDLVLLQG
jgi:hypothetical protein